MENANEINAAIKALTAKTTEKITADEALKFTQAALNLAHVAHVVKSIEKDT